MLSMTLGVSVYLKEEKAKVKGMGCGVWELF